MRSNFNKIDKELTKAIIEVIAFFDLHDCPLTSFEIWRYLRIKCEPDDVVRALRSEELNSKLHYKNGFYFLTGREENVEVRMERYNLTDKKMKRALRMARLFKFIPWIRMMAVANTVGAHNMKKEGDIDFFIVTDERRIWITRFFCVLIAEALRLRPAKNIIKNRICLSFFTTPSKLNLNEFMDSSLDPDINYVYLIAGFVPIYDRGQNVLEFKKANRWMKNYLPNFELPDIHNNRMVRAPRFIRFKNITGLIFGKLEGFFKMISYRMMNPEIIKMKNLDTRVVVNDQVLKLHLNDKRRENYYKWKSKIY